ncbi:MAG: type II secretion system F family protein, partial [Methylophilaceae bacterium]|nr:type II secretion system F family protein [Methylophilaceae bacterium]
CVLGVVVFGILPHFATLFSSLGAQTPATTRVLLSLSSWASGWRIGVGLVGVLLSVLLVRRYARTDSGRAFFDALWLRVPFIGNSMRQRASANFLQAVALLLDGGVSLVPALTIAKGVVANKVLARQLEAVVAEVSAGGSLSEALVLVSEPLFGPEVISLATVGQETGRLSFFLSRAARIVQAQVYRSVTFFATIVQPLVLIVLGLLIALLLVSVYMPVLNLANSI